MQFFHIEFEKDIATGGDKLINNLALIHLFHVVRLHEFPTEMLDKAMSMYIQLLMEKNSNDVVAIAAQFKHLDIAKQALEEYEKTQPI